MDILQAIFLGIVEGVTEFLPVSSTGHMILASRLVGITESEFLKSFEIAIQLGAILAVVVAYWKKITASKETWKRVMIAFLPTAIIGFLLYKLLKQYLLGNVGIVLWALFLGGIILIAFEWWYKRLQRVHGRIVFSTNELTYKKSFILGLIQSLAIIPGVSRSGATIVGGLAMGISRQDIVEFSFLLAIPTMVAATAYDLLKSATSFTFNEFQLLAIGFIVSFLVAMLSIKWFLSYIKNHSFIWFGVYRIAVALVFYLLIFQLKI